MYIEMAKMITPMMYPDWNWNSVVHRFCYGISTMTRCHKLSAQRTFSSERHRRHRHRRCCCYYKNGFDYVLFIVLCCCYLIDCKLIAADGNLKTSAQIVEKRINVLDSKNAPLLAVTDEEEYDDEELDEYQLLITNKSGEHTFCRNTKVVVIFAKFSQIIFFPEILEIF